MSVPLQITGAGNNDAQNVLKVTFSTACSAAPRLEAWDNSLTFPSVDTAGTTVVKEIFTGTTVNGSIPMLFAADTTNDLPGASWKPTAATAGGTVKNRLKGNVNYVQFESTPGTGGSSLFNIGLEIPSDATVPSSSSLNHLIQIRYYYSGTEPTLSFRANEGTEASPTWTVLTPNTNGLQFANLNTDWTGTVKLTIPESGVLDAPEAGITI